MAALESLHPLGCLVWVVLLGPIVQNSPSKGVGKYHGYVAIDSLLCSNIIGPPGKACPTLPYLDSFHLKYQAFLESLGVTTCLT